ncbi:hypothetical protein FEZ60_25110 [Rhodococcus sp. MS16]|uniref:hypothetical protein n=1 Tax=Rhodococcus sp. MS16 TaxID=2579941 RepID=UPI00156277E9|nr:hypothetical protein [Rhodococcus sp. MS16]NRI68804.1 hypothetical protein [Rhodococcus sp. MS16]
MAPLNEEMIEAVEGIDLTIAGETRRILAEWIGVSLTSTEGLEQINREALRLQGLTEAASVPLEQQATEEWAQANPGKTPTYLDVVRGKETAWRAAREMVLAQELYSQVTPEVIARVEKIEDWLDKAVQESEDQARRAHDLDRWKSLNVRNRPVAARIVHRVWLEKPAWFRQLAKALVAQRIEDNQPVPMTAFDPVAAELEAMINAEIRLNPPGDPNMPF